MHMKSIKGKFINGTPSDPWEETIYTVKYRQDTPTPRELYTRLKIDGGGQIYIHGIALLHSWWKEIRAT